MSMSWSEIESGILGNPELSDEARFIATKMMKLYELVTPATDFALGKKSGDTVGFELVGRIAGTSETPLSEFQKIPMGTLPRYEATGQVYQRGISLPWTQLREDLDRITVEDKVVHALKEHSARTHNKVIYDALVSGRSFTYVATGAATKAFLTTGSVAATAAAAYTAYHARQIRLQMKKYNMPPADGTNYHAVVSPTMYMNLFDDVGVNGWVDVKKYAAGGADGVLNGEVGMYQNTRYIEDNDALPDAIGTGSAYGSGFFAGYDACREISVYPMQLVYNGNLGGDFGRQKAMAWVSLIGMKVPWIYNSHGQGSLLHYTSA